jgi:hypothetical protein
LISKNEELWKKFIFQRKMHPHLTDVALDNILESADGHNHNDGYFHVGNEDISLNSGTLEIFTVIDP